jgi:hypothetical protein
MDKDGSGDVDFQEFSGATIDAANARFENLADEQHCNQFGTDLYLLLAMYRRQQLVDEYDKKKEDMYTSDRGVWKQFERLKKASRSTMFTLEMQNNDIATREDVHRQSNLAMSKLEEDFTRDMKLVTHKKRAIKSLSPFKSAGTKRVKRGRAAVSVIDDRIPGQKQRQKRRQNTHSGRTPGDDNSDSAVELLLSSSMPKVRKRVFKLPSCDDVKWEPTLKPIRKHTLSRRAVHHNNGHNGRAALLTPGSLLERSRSLPSAPSLILPNLTQASNFTNLRKHRVKRLQRQGVSTTMARAGLL